jgi:RNA polymerase sigma-70 factor (ECF subfamily)
MRTAYRLCIDRLRTNSTRPQVPLANLSAHSADSRPGPEDNAMLNDLRGAVGRALASLGPRDRAVILMREMHEMTYEQMAEAMNLPLGTLKAILHRARDRLRDALIGAGVLP